MFHSPVSGHLLVFCNREVVLAEEHVFKGKAFTFLIDEEICRITLTQVSKGQFEYQMEIDTKTNTKLNQKRFKYEQKEALKLIFLFSFVGTVILASLIAGVFFGAFEDKPAYDMEKAVRYSFARVVPEPASHYKYTVYHLYRNAMHSQDGVLIRRVGGETLTPNGFPLQRGDEFLASFVRFAPSRAYVDFTKPSPRQILRYYALVGSRLPAPVSLNAQYWHVYKRCMCEEVYAWKGLLGLADIYHKAADAVQNPLHNKLTYEHLISSPFFKMAEARCLKRQFRGEKLQNLQVGPNYDYLLEERILLNERY